MDHFASSRSSRGTLRPLLAPFLLSLAFLQNACTTTQEDTRLLRDEEKPQIEKYVGIYKGYILPRKTTRKDIKPLVADVKLTLEIKDDTLVLTTDKDLSGGVCPTDVGRLMSLNFSATSAIATFAYVSDDCALPVNISEIAVEVHELSTGAQRLTTKLPKLVRNNKSGKTPKKPTHLYGVFMKEGTPSAAPGNDIETPTEADIDMGLEPEPDPDKFED